MHGVSTSLSYGTYVTTWCDTAADAVHYGP